LAAVVVRRRVDGAAMLLVRRRDGLAAARVDF
jgi:hypothetical protein